MLQRISTIRKNKKQGSSTLREMVLMVLLVDTKSQIQDHSGIQYRRKEAKRFKNDIPAATEIHTRKQHIQNTVRNFPQRFMQIVPSVEESR